MTTTPRLWKSQTQVNTTDNGGQFGEQIAALPDGGYVIVWEDDIGFNPLHTTIVAQRYDSTGNKVGGEVGLSPGTVDAESPAVTVLANGNIAVAYKEVIPGSEGITVQVLNSSLGRIDIKFVEERFDQFQQLHEPAITAFADGSYAVAFTFLHFFNQTSDSDVYARIVSPTGVVGLPFAIDADPADHQDSSRLATLSDGNFVAVYSDEFQGITSDTDIRYGIFTKTGSPVLVNQIVPGAFDTARERDPDVAALRDGGFVVVWKDDESADRGPSDIRASILTNTGHVVASNILVNTTTSTFASQAVQTSVVALADGGFLVSWELLAAQNGVLAQRFDALGDKIGAEFTVIKDAAILDTQAAALLADGRIAFAVGDNGNGHDVATSIWTTRWPADPHPDYFNSDGPSDILWQGSDGTPAIWLMNGTNAVGVGAAGSFNPGPTWHIKTGGDFNGDDKTDILWQHDDGTPAIWLMNGTNPVSSGVAGPFHPGPSWHVKDTGDFNRDGLSDILWQGDDGTPVIWMVNGLNYIGGGAAGSSNPGPSWQIKASGDFNGDGISDILWQGTNGTPAIWLMNGTSAVAVGAVGPFNPGPSWQIKGTGDFNGDGKSDILWQNSDGLAAIWLMNGMNAVTVGAVGPFNPGPSWHIEGTGDYNGDGKSDILWQGDDGTPAIWFMDGMNFLGGAAAGSFNPGHDWHVIA